MPVKRLPQALGGSGSLAGRGPPALQLLQFPFRRFQALKATIGLRLGQPVLEHGTFALPFLQLPFRPGDSGNRILQQGLRRLRRRCFELLPQPVEVALEAIHPIPKFHDTGSDGCICFHLAQRLQLLPAAPEVPVQSLDLLGGESVPDLCLRGVLAQSAAA